MIRHHRSNLRPAIGLALMWLVVACNLTLPARDDNPAAGDGVRRDQAIFLSASQPETLDPARTHGGAGSIAGHIFSGLVTLDPTLNVQPDLAAGWQVSADGTRYTFYLHPNARFHDGRPVTAQDVIFSWERAVSPALGSDTALTYLSDIVGVVEMATGQATHIRGLRALDDRTLEVQVDAPKPYFLAKLTFPAAFVVDRENVDRPNWEYRPNGSGPFKLQAWRDDDIIILARNDASYGQVAQVRHVVYLLGADLPLSLYENDRIDLTDIGGSTLERARDPNNPWSQELQIGPSLCTSYIGFNTRIPPFDDVRVRRAFTDGLDRPRLVESLYGSDGLPAAGILPPGLPGYTARPAPSFDPARARALLAEAGYTSLPTLTFTASGYDEVGPLVTAAISLWEEALGVQIEVQLVDPYTYLDELYAGRSGHFFTAGWCADYPDPENFLDALFHTGSAQNLGAYSRPAVDARLEAARVEPDVTQRLAAYAEVETLILEDAPVVVLAHGLNSILVKPRVQGFSLAPISVTQWQRVRLTP